MKGSHNSLLLITHILPESPFNDSESIGVGDIIVGVNNHKITSLYQLSQAWISVMKSNDNITLHMRDGSLTSATVDNIKTSEEKIIGEYKSDDFIKHQ